MNKIIYIMGVSGTGKTTIGKLLSQKLTIPFFDADDYHSSSNIKKMKTGKPLNDTDRNEWLDDINKLAREQANSKGAIVACSALKANYRRKLSKGINNVEWVFLQGSYDEIYGRLEKRTGHYMPAELLASQFESLEIPDKAITVSINNKPTEIVLAIYTSLGY